MPTDENLFGGLMTTPLRQLLAQFRDTSRTEREKGNYFERLAVAFLKNDPGMAQEYEDAWLYTDWARAHGVAANDIGVDAVAKIRGEDSYCAIQCKFYANETMGDPAYPLKLFQRVVTVSLETMKIVRALPTLDIG